MTESLFSYGTLQDPDVQYFVFGRVLDGVPDALLGYTTESITVDSATYLRAIPSAHAFLKGTRYVVSVDDLKEADGYEGDAYERVELLLQSGTQALVYVRPPATRS